MKNHKLIKILFLHNEIAPYRLPLFERLNDFCDLEVFFCRLKEPLRKWKIPINRYNFKFKILRHINISKFVINYLLPFRLLSCRPDIFIMGEVPWNVVSLFITFLYAKILRKPIIIWCGNILETSSSVNLYINSFFKKMIIEFYRTFLRMYRIFLYRFTTVFIAYSKKSELFLRYYNIRKDKIFTGIQIMPKELIPKANIKKSETKFRNKRVILYLGYFFKEKGVDLLIKAFKELNNPDYVLIIAGSGKEENNLKLLAENCSNIYFVGYVEGEEKAKYYSIADLFVLPTYRDTWAYGVNEAMYYGLPIIITDAAAASEIVKEENNGIVIKSGDINSLKNAITRILNDDNLYNEMRNNSIKCKRIHDIKYELKPFIAAIKYILKNKYIS
ncbi:MAG: glycosyltransferase family 4 protein [Candidatus Helarchaeota archaeon]